MTEVQSLARGLQIIEKLAQSEEGLGITEIAEDFGLDKGNISRMIQTLVKYGYAEKAKDNRRYVLGTQIVRLSRLLLMRMSLRDVSNEFLKRLVHQTGECAHLAIYSQGQAFYIDQEESLSTLRVSTGIGSMAPLHCTALGKVFLAFSDAKVTPPFYAYTLRTITDLAMLNLHLDIVRKQGYATDDEEYNSGVRCIAVPVYDYRGKCIAAIGISGPSNRLSLDQMQIAAQAVLEAGKELSKKLSFEVNVS